MDMYTVILTFCIFRVFAVIIVVFDLKVFRYDAINVFANNQINKPTYCYLFEGF